MCKKNDWIWRKIFNDQSFRWGCCIWPICADLVGVGLQIWPDLSGWSAGEGSQATWREVIVAIVSAKLKCFLDTECLQPAEDGDYSTEPASHRAVFWSPWVASMFPLCSLLIILGLCLLYLCMGKNEGCSGPCHWEYHANLGTNTSCPRQPPQIWDQECFKLTLGPVVEAKKHPFACSPRVCYLSKAWLLCADPRRDLIYRWHSIFAPLSSPVPQGQVTSLIERSSLMWPSRLQTQVQGPGDLALGRTRKPTSPEPLSSPPQLDVLLRLLLCGRWPARDIFPFCSLCRRILPENFTFHIYFFTILRPESLAIPLEDEIFKVLLFFSCNFAF